MKVLPLLVLLCSGNAYAEISEEQKEAEEKRRELRLRQKELEKNKALETISDDPGKLTLELERFDVDKNTKN